MSEFLQSLVAVALGWLLAMLTQFFVGWTSDRRTKRQIYTRLYRILEELFIDEELARALKNVGALQTYEGLFDLDESWTKDLPHKAPQLPEDFDSVVEHFSLWEAARGQYEITKKLLNLKALVRHNTALYAGLETFAKNPELGQIPERALSIYNSSQERLKEAVTELLNVTSLARLGPYRRIRWWFQHTWGRLWALTLSKGNRTIDYIIKMK